MSVWRLPPILIVHLKRFQYDRDTRRKLRHHVVFPVQGLDLSAVVMGNKHNGKQRHQRQRKYKDNNHDNSCDKHDTSFVSDVTNGCTDNDNPYIDSTCCSNKSNHGGEDHNENELYDLYGIVHHLGALHGGHYVTSLRSETDGKWRLFNDAQITEISENDIVDSSAYILFYIRRDVKGMQLDNVWNKNDWKRKCQHVNGDRQGIHEPEIQENNCNNNESDTMTVTEEDIENIIRQRDRCCIR